MLLVGLNTAGLVAQDLQNSTWDTPSHRWLPPPASFPADPASQAKLISRLRDSLQWKDSISSDLLEKALSDPELRRRAMESTQKSSDLKADGIAPTDSRNRPSDPKTPQIADPPNLPDPRPTNDTSRTKKDTPSPTNSSSRTKPRSGTNSLNVKQELDRGGLVPTLQKLIEDVQRTSKAEAENLASKPPASTSKSTSSSTDGKDKSSWLQGWEQNASSAEKVWKETVQNTNPSSPTPPELETSSGSGKSSLLTSSSIGTFVMIGLLTLGVFAFLTYRATRTRHERTLEEIALSQQVEEISSRDDIVHACHAMAKHRLQLVQAWWTYGHVSNYFQRTVPGVSPALRILDNVYEQARYYPADHQLTPDQIENAKLALRQCRN